LTPGNYRISQAPTFHAHNDKATTNRNPDKSTNRTIYTTELVHVCIPCKHYRRRRKTP